MVIDRSFITQEANGRRSFEEIVLIGRNSGCFLDDCFRRAAYESAVVARATNVPGNDEESGWKTKPIHDRHGYAELINRSIVVGERDSAALAILPLCNFRLIGLADPKRWRSKYQRGDSYHNDCPHHRTSSPSQKRGTRLRELQKI